MEMKEEYFINDCIHGSDLPCTVACPFSLDVKKFLDKVKLGSLNSAYTVYRDAVIFPGIVYKLCPAPCRNVCAGQMEGFPIKLLSLEKSAYNGARNHDPLNYAAPRQAKKVAVLGSDLIGMTFAMRLSQSGFEICVFSSDDRICVDLEAYLERSEFEQEILSQFKYSKYYSLKLSCDLSKKEYAGYDVIINTINSFDTGCPDKSYELMTTGVPVYDIQTAKIFAREIDRLCRTGKVPDVSEIEPLRVQAAVINAHPEAYDSSDRDVILDKNQSKEEAARCKNCDCTKCLESCVLLRTSNVTVEGMAAIAAHNLNIFEHAETREDMRKINGCNFCGLCKAVCPEGVDLAGFLLDTRTELYKQNAIAPAQHEFWIRDMNFSDSNEASLFYMPGAQKGRYMFFPGCQAGGSDPRYVSMTYERILEKYPDTSLLLHCCGAPVLWEGNLEALDTEHEKIRRYWSEAGCPEVIMICPSCQRMFSRYLPEIPVKMLYDVIDFEIDASLPFDEAAVFDPCSSRYDTKTQNQVRMLAEKSGVALQELKYHGKKTQCCSWGGHVYNVNRTVTLRQAEEQISQSSLPYITYCTNCRDIFAYKGKEVRHILDIINGINLDDRRDNPSLTQRRENRRRLRRDLIEKYSIDTVINDETPLIDIRMDSKVEKQLTDDLILLEDVSAVISNAERSGFYLIDSDTGHFYAHLKVGVFTYWAEYSKNEDGSYELYRSYHHRMDVKDDVVDAVQWAYN